MAQKQRNEVHVLLKKPWIVKLMENTGLEGKPNLPKQIAQLLEFKRFPTESKPVALVEISDGYNYCKAILSQTCIQNFLEEHPNWTLARLKGSIVSLLEFGIFPNASLTQFWITIEKLKFVGAEGSFPYGISYPANSQPSIQQTLQKISLKNKSNSPSSIDSSLTPRALLALADSLSQEFESESTDQPTSKITEDPTNDSTLLDISEFEIPQSQAEYLNRIQDGWAIGTSNNDNHNNATINIPNSPPKFSMAETDSSSSEFEEIFSSQVPLQVQKGNINNDEINSQPASQYPNIQHSETQYPDNQYSEVQYPNTQYSEIQYPKTQYSEVQHPDDQYSEVQYPNTQYSEVQCPDNQYSEAQHLNTQHEISPSSLQLVIQFYKNMEEKFPISIDFTSWIDK